MRIVYIGNYGPAHSTENHYARSFEALGHEVVRMQEPSDVAETKPFLHEVWDEVRSAPETALLLYTRTWGLLPAEDAERLWRAVEELGCVTAAVHLDRWHGLGRVDELRSQAMFSVGHVFTADGDHHTEWEAAGINHHWLRPGVVADECYDAEPDPEWQGRWSVAFVGSAPIGGGTYHTEWPHRGELVRQLRSWYGRRFVHVGNGGQLANNHDRPNLRGDDLNRLYASVAVTVGDSCLMTPDGRYASDRVYEAPGRGGFLIHPALGFLQDEIGDYPSWALGNWTELRERIEYWLVNPAEREAKRQEISAAVRSRSTYTHRAAEMLDVLGLAGWSGEAALS